MKAYLLEYQNKSAKVGNEDIWRNWQILLKPKKVRCYKFSWITFQVIICLMNENLKDPDTNKNLFLFIDLEIFKIINLLYKINNLKFIKRYIIKQLNNSIKIN